MPAASNAVRFAAPLGLGVRLTTILTLALSPVLAVVMLGFRLLGVLPARTGWIAALAPLALLALTVVLVVSSWICGYRLQDRALHIERIGRTETLPLDGLLTAAIDHDALKFALKTWGNDGAGAICGRYWNRRLGAFRAYVTDRSNIVVLRWPDRTVVLSPDRPAAFVSAVQLRTGLRH